MVVVVVGDEDEVGFGQFFEIDMEIVELRHRVGVDDLAVVFEQE